MKKNCFLLALIQQFLWVLICIPSLHAQNLNLNNITPISSQSLSMGDLSNITNDVDMFTGRLNYGIQLTTVPMAGINIPVAVNYSTTGFKVQEVAGVLGLGWSNSFSGVITRSVRDLPDEYYYGFCGQNKSGTYNNNSYSNDLFDKLNSSDWDSEPDQFYFSFLGFSGSFVLDSDGNPVMQSTSSGLRITQSALVRVNGTLEHRWILKDQLGNQYVFGEEFTEGVQNYLHYETGGTYQIYASSWYLKKIITANNEEINYTYTSITGISYTNYINMKRIVGGCSNLSNATWNENIDFSTVYTYFLNKIEYKNQSIKFDYDLARLDLLNSKALTGIKIYYDNVEKQNFSFNYSYFISDDGQNERRLKLESISQNFLGSVSKKLNTFFYNEVPLPARNSVRTDLWGYYNSNFSSNNIIGESDKSPSTSYTQAGVLEKVLNSLGGSTYFEYQLNRYFDGTQNQNIGGLRIYKTYQKAKEFDTNVYNQIEYDYNMPSSTQSSGQKFDKAESYSYSIPYNTCGPTRVSDVYKSSEPLSSLFDINGSPLGYSYVTAKKTDGSSVRYKFTNYSDYPDEIEQGEYRYYDGSVGSFRNELPGLGNTVLSFAHGKILTEEVLNTAGELVNRKSYTYALSQRLNEVIGIKAIQYILADPPSFKFGKTRYFTQDLQLVTKSETFFRNNQVRQEITQTYTYTDYAKNLVRSISQTGSGDRIDKYNFRYPFDIPYRPISPPSINLPLTYLLYNNIIGNPIEVVHSVVRNEIPKIVSVSLTTYHPDNASNSVVPYIEYGFESKAPLLSSEYVPFNVYYNNGNEEQIIDPRLKQYKIYTKYDQNRSLIESQQVGQTLPSSVIYGYNGLYKTAEVLNSEVNNIAYTSFESTEKGSWNYIGTPIFDIGTITGNKNYDLSKGLITRNNLTANKSYILTYWTKNSSPYSIIGTQGNTTLLSDRNGWRNFQHNITGINDISISGTGLIDELRLYPVGAKMVSSTYAPFVGVTSKTDENNQITYYSFDEFNRLQLIKDSNKNIRQALAYSNYDESINYFNTFSSVAKSLTFSKSDCGLGIQGTSVIYSIEAGRYKASTQILADALAQKDVDENGQAYANANGTCLSQGVYARVERSNYAYYQNSYGSGTEVDVYIKFYSNSACTIPYTLPNSIITTVAEGYTMFGYYEGSGSTNVNYAVPIGVNSYFIGRRILDASETINDPLDGDRIVYSQYTFDLLNNNNNYIPLTTY